MRKVIKLTESDIINLVKRIISEDCEKGSDCTKAAPGISSYQGFNCSFKDGEKVRVKLTFKNGKTPFDTIKNGQIETIITITQPERQALMGDITFNFKFKYTESDVKYGDGYILDGKYLCDEKKVIFSEPNDQTKNVGEFVFSNPTTQNSIHECWCNSKMVK